MSLSRPLVARHASLGLSRALCSSSRQQLSYQFASIIPASVPATGRSCPARVMRLDWRRDISTTRPTFKKAKEGKRKEQKEEVSDAGHSKKGGGGLSDDPFDFTKFDESVKHAVEGCRTEMANMKAFSGRVDPSVVENLVVTISQGGKEKGGEKEVKMKLSELAHVAPKGREFILTVNDESFVNYIKNTLLSQMSLNPQPVSPTTPNILKIPIPMPTKESRQNTAGLVQKAGQKWLDKVQHIRGAHFAHLEKLNKGGKARPDDCRKAEKKLQEKLDKTNKELKQAIEKVKQEVLQS
ncbi:hypothetical protein DRE_05947 [Drechslerella stenobrocha 248]|uniref:Ribosome recycling factor domain-containing protein n=1 Tax=Drechslerella stenobrocha 248 TaxID=1043628 RepID=W7I891_9PEZI|nr:hypothetical protein DRE_05947 [Drechslerella stenobrocha 248]